MRAEFLRHEYTWSRESISGTTGLGIVSSSSPKDTEQLRELEKMASMAEADSETGVEVELLMYHVRTGFVKLAVKPAPAAEDQRENKRVYLHQCKEKNTMDPAIYCLPKGSWTSDGDVELPEISLEDSWDSSKNIFLRYQCVDRLPDLFRAIFWCVFRGINNLAFVIPWPRSVAAMNSREIMYAIHSILPENIRKNAGYASCGCGMNQCSSFYFTSKKPENNYFDLLSQEYIGSGLAEDALDQFFFEKLAVIYWEQDALYHEFLHLMQETIGERKIDKNLLREIQWIFLQFCIQNMMDIPSFEEICNLAPQLFYIASESDRLAEVQDNLMEYYHLGNWSREQYENYLRILESGFTKKGGDKVLEEIDWVLKGYAQKYPKICRDYIEHFRKNNFSLYSRYMVRFAQTETSIARQIFEDSKEDLRSMKEYIQSLDAKMISEAMKDEWMFRGIEILNADIFDVEKFEQFSEISEMIERKQQWMEILSEFLKQLNDRKDELDETRMLAFESIQKIYYTLKGNQLQNILPMSVAPGDVSNDEEEKHFKKDKSLARKKRDYRKRSKTEKKSHDLLRENREKEAEGMKKDIESEKVQEVYRTIDGKTSGRYFFSFLLRGLPYGFLTGCVLFLVNYGFVLGHWKISLGAAGMWLIMILNYATERLEKRKKDGYRLWMAIGLSIVEGYIIQVIAWVFLSKNYRVYFFLGLGILTVVLQCIQMILIRIRRDKQKEED